jgi:hypothetical protein
MFQPVSAGPNKLSVRRIAETAKSSPRLLHRGEKVGWWRKSTTEKAEITLASKFCKKLANSEFERKALPKND